MDQKHLGSKGARFQKYLKVKETPKNSPSARLRTSWSEELVATWHGSSMDSPGVKKRVNEDELKGEEVKQAKLIKKPIGDSSTLGLAKVALTIDGRTGVSSS